MQTSGIVIIEVRNCWAVQCSSHSSKDNYSFQTLYTGEFGPLLCKMWC